jgi:hypothetical protein
VFSADSHDFEHIRVIQYLDYEQRVRASLYPGEHEGMSLYPREHEHSESRNSRLSGLFGVSLWLPTAGTKERLRTIFTRKIGSNSNSSCKELADFKVVIPPKFSPE